MGTPDQRFRSIGDLTVLDLESQRQVIQERLDTAKTAAERNRLGQFATPPNLALDIARYALGLWQGRTDVASFLDPAIGSGSFYSAFCQTFPVAAIADAAGWRSIRRLSTLQKAFGHLPACESSQAISRGFRPTALIT